MAAKYPFLVPPIYDRSALFTPNAIRALWFEADGALKPAQRIVCMGYSFPESVLTKKHFLRTKTAPDGQFEMVDPAAEALPTFAGFSASPRPASLNRAPDATAFRALSTSSGRPGKRREHVNLGS